MSRTRKVPQSLRLVSMLSISITVTVSVAYSVLSILGLVYRYQCDVGDPASIDGADYFVNLLYRTYIQKDDCSNSLAYDNLTQSDSVFLLNIITLCASILCFAAAISFMIIIMDDNNSSHVQLAAYVYIGVSVASQVVDLTVATHFGMDFSNLTDMSNESSPGVSINHEKDLLRLAALLLMTISLKGFVANAINCVLFVLIALYVMEYQAKLQKEGHSIHKMGAINAFDSQPRQMDPWQPEPQMFTRGYPQINPAYIEEVSTPPPRSTRREPSTADYSRSESWQNGRPFSYLEEPKRQAPAATRPAAPAQEPAWRGDWPPPPVPAPDYSPHTPRRLKPALKPYI